MINMGDLPITMHRAATRMFWKSGVEEDWTGGAECENQLTWLCEA